MPPHPISFSAFQDLKSVRYNVITAPHAKDRLAFWNKVLLGLRGPFGRRHIELYSSVEGYEKKGPLYLEPRLKIVIARLILGKDLEKVHLVYIACSSDW